MGSVSIVRRFNSPKIQLKLKQALTLTLTLTDTGGAVLTLTDTGDLRTIEHSDYQADAKLWPLVTEELVPSIKDWS